MLQGLTPLSDENLIECYRCESGSAPAGVALDELFRRYHARVATWCYRMTGNRDKALDLSQEVFLKAYQHLDSFQGTSKFSTWLYAISRNHCLNQLKASASEPAETGGEVPFDLPDQNALDPAERVEAESSIREMRRLMIETLDDAELKVMTLHYAEELPLDVVTRLMGLTNASGARAYIVSARRKLNIAIQRWRARRPSPIRGLGSGRQAESL